MTWPYVLSGAVLAVLVGRHVLRHVAAGLVADQTRLTALREMLEKAKKEEASWTTH